LPSNPIGTVKRTKADLGVLIRIEEPSEPILKEAVYADFFKS